MRCRRKAVSILLRDDLTLLSNAHLSPQSARRQRFEEHMCRAGSAPYRAAAAVKESQLDTRLLSDGRQPYLCFSQIPMARKNAAIFIAVAVSYHDFLQWPR